jgi:hypothetical protein
LLLRRVLCCAVLCVSGADVSLELPTIVVCGQQSAGKSSVVEVRVMAAAGDAAARIATTGPSHEHHALLLLLLPADVARQNICGIPLPRAADTCTRCPTEVRLSQAPPTNGALWEATVKLRREGGLAAASRALHHQHSSTKASGSSSVPHSPSGRYPAIPGGYASGQQQQQQASVVQAPVLSHDAPAAAAEKGEPFSLEAVFRAGIHRPEDLPAAMSAAQACLLTGQASRPAGEPGKRAVQHSSSLGHGAGGSPAAGDAGALWGSIESMPLMAGAPGGHSSHHAAAPGHKFSRDVVVVEVAGAPIDLTLIDLPGELGCRLAWLPPKQLSGVGQLWRAPNTGCAGLTHTHTHTCCCCACSSNTNRHHPKRGAPRGRALQAPGR